MLAGVLLAAALTLETAAAAVELPHVDVHVGPPAAIVELAKARGMSDPDKVVGLAQWWSEGCEIYVPPLTWRTLSIWTHELRHCTEGYFHGQPAD